LIIIFALIVLIGLIYFMFLAPVKEKTPAVSQPPAVAEKITEQPIIETLPPKAVRKENVTEDDLRRLAASFVERYGSYSNQSGYANIRDLKIFMSRAMQAWAEDYLEQARRKNAATDIYYGITTKAVTVETKQFDEYAGNAEFNVKTQRKESMGVGANARSFQQEAEIGLIKEGGVWKVNRVAWKE